MLLKNILFTALIFVISYAPAAFSQSPANDINKNPDKTLSINESNFYCFQNLQCLKSENPFENTDLSGIKLNGFKEKYVIQGKSKNEEMYAEYNGSTGNLITAMVIQRNIHLPRNILVGLSTGEYSDWSMVGNTRIIKNFTKNSTRYEVVMMKDGELRIEYFDANGNTIAPII